ncbi:MAG: PAS domain-containing sensor histidine kinase [Ignavibacteriaceae bacterium]|jgi:PAS domain S-box-containing protein|nr:PAS domain-containing sensor histidine kinase [Ignavibacteriaceae bacterium]
MRSKSQKLQLKLTIEFALFFIVISVFIFVHFTNKFEDQINDKYAYKADVFVNYFRQSPNAFTDEKFSDKAAISNLLDLNRAVYLVIEKPSGEILDAINLDIAENNLYVLSKSQKEGISQDEKVYRVALSIEGDNVSGKIYVGFESQDDAKQMLKNRMLTALFSLSILMAGIVFTYFLSSISFRPLAKIFKALDSANISADIRGKKNSKKSELRVLEDRVNILLGELDRSSGEVESLNKKLHDVFKDKIAELNFEINQRKKAEILLQKSEEQFRLVFQNAPIGIVIISTEGKIISVNRSFCNTVGFERDEIIGIPVKYLFERNDLEGFDDDSLEYNGKPIADINTEKTLLKKEGKEINVIVKLVSVLDEKNKVKHYVMQLLDITEIKRVQQELVDALKKAEESDRLKSAFLAQTSHEIRTPLNVILTSIPLLADEISSEDEESKIILDSVKSAGRRLHRTIDMILNMSSVQSGNYKPSFEKFDLLVDLKKLMNEFKSLSDDKGLELRFIHSIDSSSIVADRYTVNQIFQNLINNAIKYTLKGYVEVFIRNENDNKIRVEIRDSGIGMSDEYLKKIFTPFSQEDVGYKREFEGNGLGLALVKKYVELNRAEIEVESEKSIGSVFSVTFDLNVNFENDPKIKKHSQYQ